MRMMERKEGRWGFVQKTVYWLGWEWEGRRNEIHLVSIQLPFIEGGKQGMDEVVMEGDGNDGLSGVC